MRRTAVLPVLVTSVLLITGCGAKGAGTSSAPAANAPVATAPAAPASAGAAAAPADASGCPTSNTTKLAKTKFVLHAGEAFGTFHRYIYGPFRNGSFTKGGVGKVRLYLKAGATALFDKRQVRLMIVDVKANPTLCKLIAQPLSDLSSKLSAIGTKVRSGDTSGISDANTAIAAVEAKSQASGTAIQENANAAVS